MKIVCTAQPYFQREKRLRRIGINIMIHTQRAYHNANLKGVDHYDTVYEWEIVEELSSALANELRKIQDEKNATYDKSLTFADWDNKEMSKTYDI